MFDVVIHGGEVVDGTGAPRRRADVGITEGRVVALGSVDGPARRTIDAESRLVTPGFVDPHTHYDAQVFWDPWLTPSLPHGVTTVVGGNCGFGIAPIEPDASDYLMQLLARVEGMSLEALQSGVPWGDWTSMQEYFARLDNELGVNAAFQVGHSTLRRLVMGDAATQRAANDAELDKMCALLAQSLAAGGLGFSSGWSSAHSDTNGDPVPSRWAKPDELVALAAVCRDFEGTALEFIPALAEGFAEGQEIMARMSAAAQRPLNWNLLEVDAARLHDALTMLEAGTYARQRGGRVVALTQPMTPVLRFSFRTGFLLDALNGWGKAMALPSAEKLALLRDPVQRRLLEESAKDSGSFNRFADWEHRVIEQTFSPTTKQYEGRPVRDIATEQGKGSFDALLDIVCEDELRTVFTNVPVLETREDWQARLQVWRDDRSLIGGSDAGAHLDFIATFNLQAWFLDRVVREEQLLPFEEAIHYFTDAPARLYGLRDRGRLAEGAWADIVVIDEATVGSGPVETRFDLPTHAGRLYAEPRGIDHVLVNGVEVVQGGQILDERPGKVLRSGRDTYTPALT